MSEADYIRGRNAALRRMMLDCARELGVFTEGDDPLLKLAALADERARAVNALRKVCEAHGSNDWPDNLDLEDVIEKRLGRYLGE